MAQESLLHGITCEQPSDDECSPAGSEYRGHCPCPLLAPLVVGFDACLSGPIIGETNAASSDQLPAFGFAPSSSESTKRHLPSQPSLPNAVGKGGGCDCRVRIIVVQRAVRGVARGHLEQAAGAQLLAPRPAGERHSAIRAQRRLAHLCHPLSQPSGWTQGVQTKSLRFVTTLPGSRGGSRTGGGGSRHRPRPGRPRSRRSRPAASCRSACAAGGQRRAPRPR